MIATAVNSGTTTYATKSDKVDICHATNAQTNPYTVNSANTSSVDEKNNKFLNGHGDHEGGVWFKGIADHSWGDIIPPFESPKGTKYAGQNWNEAGKAVYNNGCKAASVTSVKVTKESSKTATAPAVMLAAAATELPHTGAAGTLGAASMLSAVTYAIVRRAIK